MTHPDIEETLVSEIGLSRVQARLYLLVTTAGRMDAATMASGLEISSEEARRTAEDLVSAGAFIEYNETQYEAMHPRFTAVNMYRKACERRGIAFGRNKAVDNIGVALEQPYDHARTK